MDAALRRLFNRQFTADLYDRYCSDLTSRLDVSFGYRLAETPVFLPSSLRDVCVQAAREIVTQLQSPVVRSELMKAIPDRWNAPAMDDLPSFAQVDFAIVREADGALAPRLIELQGFPSLAGFQVIQRDVWSDILSGLDGLDRSWSCWFSGLDRESFLRLFRETVLGRHLPEDVVLLDIAPELQKTFPDFRATEQLLEVTAVCPTRTWKEGRRLFRRDASGRPVQIRRVYNRVVFDELIQKQLQLPFDFRDELDVEWAPHPNWYWAWSKYALPWLRHPCVPPTRFLSDVEDSGDLSRQILKPLFSFAGGGVTVDPTAEDIRRIPAEQRRDWCLQEKIDYAPALEAVDGGGVKVEMRVMLFRPDGASELIPAENLCRLSRGKMMGVDYNRDFTWVGSSVALTPDDHRP